MRQFSSSPDTKILRWHNDANNFEPAKNLQNLQLIVVKTSLYNEEENQVLSKSNFKSFV